MRTTEFTSTTMAEGLIHGNPVAPKKRDFKMRIRVVRMQNESKHPKTQCSDIGSKHKANPEYI